MELKYRLHVSQAASCILPLPVTRIQGTWHPFYLPLPEQAISPHIGIFSRRRRMLFSKSILNRLFFHIAPPVDSTICYETTRCNLLISYLCHAASQSSIDGDNPRFELPHILSSVNVKVAVTIAAMKRDSKDQVEFRKISSFVPPIQSCNVSQTAIRSCYRVTAMPLPLCLSVIAEVLPVAAAAVLARLKSLNIHAVVSMPLLQFSRAKQATIYQMLALLGTRWTSPLRSQCWT